MVLARERIEKLANEAIERCKGRIGRAHKKSNKEEPGVLHTLKRKHGL